MRIQKILNNNVVLSQNGQGKEIVVMGRGIAFRGAVGDAIDPERIEKIFTLSEPGVSEKFIQVVESIPLAHILLSERVINYAKTQLGKRIGDSIYVTLPDHISAAILRYQEGIELKNPLKWDISRFYKDEYAIGLAANEIVYKETGVRFLDDEAAFIALHFVNAQLGEEMGRVYDITYIMQEVCGIVKSHFNMDLDEESLNYYRFITHLKFFAQRLLSGIHYDDDEQELLQVIRQKYPNAYHCTEKVRDLVAEKYGFIMTPDEVLYLTIHIARIIPQPAGLADDMGGNEE